MAIPWSICREQLTGDPLAVIHADSMERRVVEKQIEAVPDCDLVIAIGGGRAVDLGKYLAFKRGLRLITIPTVLSVDAFVTPAAGLRENGRVTYVGNASPDPLVIDYNILRTAPPELNIAASEISYRFTPRSSIGTWLRVMAAANTPFYRTAKPRLIFSNSLKLRSTRFDAIRTKACKPSWMAISP